MQQIRSHQESVARVERQRCQGLCPCARQPWPCRNPAPGLSVPEVRRSKGGTSYLRNAVRGAAFAPQPLRPPGLSVPEVRRSKGGTTYLRNAVRGAAFAPRRSLPLASSGAGGVFAVGPRPGHVHSVPQVGIVACLPSSCCSAAQRVTITRLLAAGCFALCHAKDVSVPVLCQVVYKHAAH